MKELDLENNLSEKDARELNALSLAFLGDAVYSLMVRGGLVKTLGEKAGSLNRKATAMVRASYQAKAYNKIEAILNESEANIAGRARNIHTSNVPKTSNLEEYKKATSLEAVIGYNYITGNIERLNTLFKLIREELWNYTEKTHV